LLILNVPLQIGKCTLRGTCTPVWEPLIYNNRSKNCASIFKN